MRVSKVMVVRLVIACLFGGVVTTCALFAARDVADETVSSIYLYDTSKKFKEYHDAITDYRHDHGRLPNSLAELTASTRPSLQDGWGHKLSYTPRAPHFLVISYGQDGKPGGAGLDSDITSDFSLDQPHGPRDLLQPLNGTGNHPNRFLNNPHVKATRHKLIEIAELILSHNDENGSLPQSLDQLWITHYPYMRNKDGWGHPIIYTLRGSDFVLTSYGRDGKPGGFGYDMDVTSDNPYPRSFKLSLYQFLIDPFGKQLKLYALLAGFLAGLLCFATIGPTKFTWLSTIKLAVQFILLLLGSAFVATIIMASHVPSGH